jgi:sulfate transport system permease protein
MTALSPPAPAPAPAVSIPAIRGSGRLTRYVVRFLALGYLAALLALPVGLIFYRTFESGLAPVLNAVGAPSFQHAFWLTLTITAIAVPINTAFGIIGALALVRARFPGRGLLNGLIDLPFALSPVVIGLSLVLVYGKNGWLGPWLGANGIQVIFAVPGMVLATVFVSLPFVVREVIPVLREIGTDQEEAAYTLGASSMRTFWRVTLPAIRWGVIYGILLTTARSLGEFGAVSIVSGRLSDKTETLTLYVQQRFEEFDLVGAYTASVVLALVAISVLLGMNILQSGRFHLRRSATTALAASGLEADERTVSSPPTRH